MIHFEGVEAFAAAPDAVFAKLSDAGFLAGCLPDSTVTEATADRAAWKVRPKLAFLSGELDTVATVTERVGGESVRYRLETKGVGSGSVVEAVLRFAADGTGTTVTWVGDITSVSGLLKLAPKGLVQATARKVIADVWAAIKPKAEG
jgi:carbon monoxide dehydrogenase subunit G